VSRAALLIALLGGATAVIDPVSVSFATSDGGRVVADLYGKGERAIILAHGGRFDKESWSRQARVLAAAGYRVLAINFRGYGESSGPGQADPLSAPLELDVLAAVRYLREPDWGVKWVSIVGGSMGGSAGADAAALSSAGEIEAIVLLGSSGGRTPEKIPGRKLVIATKDDADGSGTLRLPKIRAAYEKMTEPKEILVLEGSAHAQYLFDTPDGEPVMREILKFLSSPS
jgi:pimeloyl-ACP methyl ester carboxylesterase